MAGYRPASSSWIPSDRTPPSAARSPSTLSASPAAVGGVAEAAQQGRHEPAPLGGHAVGGVVVVPVGKRGAQVAVEGVDEDLEGLLEGGEQEPLGLGGCLAREPLGRHAEVA